MSDENQKESPKVQANNNGVAIGSLSIDGNIEGNITIGNTIGYTSEEVSILLKQITSTFQQKPFDGKCPYKGLDVFEENDAELFFGREKLVDDLVSRVKVSRTVFITGPSGSGKSSLVRAGLIYALKQGALQEVHSERWLYVTMKPGRDPVDTLGSAFARLKSPELGKYLRENAVQAATLNECAESALTDQKDQRLVLFIDQFEEIFTQVNKVSEREIFLNLLTYAASKENGRVILLFAMRSDFIPSCATYSELNDLLNRQFIQVGAMQPNELVSAIAQPALRVGLRIDPDLIAQVTNEMQGQTEALPLMQFALKDLFDSQKEKGGVLALTLSGYLQRGGIHKALERHADASLAEFGDKEKELARSIFSGLIEVGRGTQETRRTAIFRELIPVGEQAETIQSIIRKLADARLITTDDQTVTISHEKLINAWPWLKKLVNENKDVIALQNEIAEHAREWDEHQQDESYLYTGGRLVNAREKLDAKKLVLSGLAQQFVAKGMELEESKHRAEERRLQKELDDARKLAQAAQAQVKAERRSLLVTRGILILVTILIVLISYDPVKNWTLKLQAKGNSPLSYSADNVELGNPDWANDENALYFYPDRKYPLAAFAIEPAPVTYKRYQKCIEAKKCTPPFIDPSIYENNDELSVANVQVIQAAQFCNWIGRRLPTDKEWELFARKNKATKIYEWTSTDFEYDVMHPEMTHEWVDLSITLPARLTTKGGGQDLGQIITRIDKPSYSQDEKTGFRCAESR